jgi:TetR/AcrR family transcriptional repressor of nem operon
MRNSELTRELIISKALPIFNTKGYHATSLSDITKATGITKGAIYGNFKNKDEVASAAFDLASTIVMDNLSRLISEQYNAPSKLQAIVDYFAEYVLNPPIEGGCPILNTSVEADDNHAFLRTKVIRSIAMIKDGISKIVYRGISEGQLKTGIEVEEFTISFYATINGGIALSRAEGDDRSFKFIRRSLSRMIDELTV